MKPLLPAGAGAVLAAVVATDASAQRAVQSPSSEVAAPGAEAPPPPGVLPSACGALIVCGGELAAQLQALATSGSDKTKGAASTDATADLYANYSDWLSLNSTIKLERQRSDNLDSFFPDSNAFFRSEGLTLRQLFLAARPGGGTVLYGGKIHPNFGSAYEQTPGNFYNFGTDYEQDERIGVGAQYALPEALGHRIRVSLEAFFLDTSVLSNSLLSRPAFDDPDPTVRVHRYSLGQFGPSNTNSLDSYTLAIRGGEPERGLTYQVSFTREASDEPGARKEFGQSVGVSYDPTGDGIPLTTRLGVTPFLEYTHFSNFQANPGLERHYLVGGAAFHYVRWELDVALGLRHTSDDNNPPDQAFTNAVATQERRAWDHQESVSLNYAFPFAISYDLSIGFGVNHVAVASRHSWSFGPSLGFGTRF